MRQAPDRKSSQHSGSGISTSVCRGRQHAAGAASAAAADHRAGQGVGGAATGNWLSRLCLRSHRPQQVGGWLSNAALHRQIWCIQGRTLVALHRRAWQAAQAVASVAAEYAADLQRGVVQPPPRVLRRLFERLGSTYIKLGQVCFV